MSQITSQLNQWSNKDLADYFSLMFFDYLIVREPEFSKRLLAANPTAFYAHSKGNDINTHLAYNHQLCQHNKKLFFDQLVKSNPYVFAKLEPSKSISQVIGIPKDLISITSDADKLHMLPFNEINSFIADVSRRGLSAAWWPSHFENSDRCTLWMRNSFHKKMDSNSSEGDGGLIDFLSSNI